MARPLSIAICGASRERDPAVLELARRVGAAVFEAGCHLISGGRDGMMSAACEGFARARAEADRAAASAPGGGAPPRAVAVGIIPSGDPHDANAACDVVIPTAMGYARNVLVALAGDAVILLGGGSGTLCEAAYAWQLGKPMVALVPTGGWAAALAGTRLDDRRADQVWPAGEPEEAVRLALELARAERTTRDDR